MNRPCWLCDEVHGDDYDCMGYATPKTGLDTVIDFDGPDTYMGIQRPIIRRVERISLEELLRLYPSL